MQLLEPMCTLRIVLDSLLRWARFVRNGPYE
jgi:hypothetical protein